MLPGHGRPKRACYIFSQRVEGNIGVLHCMGRPRRWIPQCKMFVYHLYMVLVGTILQLWWQFS